MKADKLAKKYSDNRRKLVEYNAFINELVSTIKELKKDRRVLARYTSVSIDLVIVQLEEKLRIERKEFDKLINNTVKPAIKLGL